jgi:hypothetical protein
MDEAVPHGPGVTRLGPTITVRWPTARAVAQADRDPAEVMQMSEVALGGGRLMPFHQAHSFKSGG